MHALTAYDGPKHEKHKFLVDTNSRCLSTVRFFKAEQR